MIRSIPRANTVLPSTTPSVPLMASSGGGVRGIPEHLAVPALLGDTRELHHHSEMPLGGFKQSGWSKDRSMYTIEDYTVVKHVMVNSGA